MANLDKSSGLKESKRTTDWEVVFEDPKKGLIPLISQAQTAAELRKRTILVIENLYKRKYDAPEIERFNTELTQMIPDDTTEKDLPRVKKVVTGILRHIKEERILKAVEHEKYKDVTPEEKPPSRTERRNLAPTEPSREQRDLDSKEEMQRQIDRANWARHDKAKHRVTPRETKAKKEPTERIAKKRRLNEPCLSG